jgi:hypothetical protein
MLFWAAEIPYSRSLRPRRAVDIKNWFQTVMNKSTDEADEVLSVREATPADVAEGERLANEAHRFIAIPDHLLRRG